MAGVNMAGIILNVQTKKEEFIKNATTIISGTAFGALAAGNLVAIQADYWCSYPQDIQDLDEVPHWGYTLSAASHGQPVQVRLLP
jgi:hypothetical protein